MQVRKLQGLPACPSIGMDSGVDVYEVSVLLNLYFVE
jgi:hypothetical protein